MKNQKKFEEIYRSYVIKEKDDDCFVGPSNEMYRVRLREWAARFTKQEALDYIENGAFCKEGGPFVIEDAT